MTPAGKKLEINENLLYEKDKIAIPRLKDFYKDVDLVDVLKVNEYIQHHGKTVLENIAPQGVKSIPQNYIGIFVPLDSYIPLPEPYYADSVTLGEDKQVSDIGLVLISGCEVRTIVNNYENRSRISIALCSLKVAEDFQLENVTQVEISEYYDRILRGINAVIDAYKLTPHRHNHDLKLATRTNRDSSVQAITFRFGDKSVLEAKKFDMHDNVYASVMHSRKLEPVELNIFRQINVDLSFGDSEAYDIIEWIIRAIDAKCEGDFESCVVYADKFGELFLRFVYCHLLMSSMDPDDALKATNAINSIDSLITKMANKLGKTAKGLKTLIHNENWKLNCRDLRNDINHNFLKFKVTPEQAVKAVNSTIVMISELSDLVEGGDDRLNRILGIFKSTDWLVKAQDK